MTNFILLYSAKLQGMEKMPIAKTIKASTWSDALEKSMMFINSLVLETPRAEFAMLQITISA